MISRFFRNAGRTSSGKLKKFLSLLIFCTSFASSFSLASCKRPSYQLQKKYGNDINYFLGLKALQRGDIQEAQKNFSFTSKKGSEWCARRSYENLILLQNQKNRIEMEDLYLEKYRDQDALLFAVQDYFTSKEFSRVIFFTNELDFYSASASLIALRLKAMKEKNDSRLPEEIFKWFLECPLSSEHQNFFTENAEFIEENLNENQKELLNFRLLAIKRQYSEAVEKVQGILDLFESEGKEIPSTMCSDIGKVLLYGNKNYLQNVRILEKYLSDMAKEKENSLQPQNSSLNSKTNNINSRQEKSYWTENKDSENAGRNEAFYFNFYAGRIYELAGDYYSRAENCYRKAMEFSSSDDHADNALWYLLKLAIRKNSLNGSRAIQENAKIWHNSAYFDDLLDLLSNLLLTEGKWNEFYKIYKKAQGYLSPYMESRYAYISARLLQEKLADSSSYDQDDSPSALFEASLKSADDFYYMVSAISRMELTNKEIEKFVCKTRLLDKEKGEKTDRNAEILLRGYADFGFADKIYPEFVKLSSTGSIFSMDTICALSAFLNECGKNFPKYYPQSLRMVAKALKKSDRKITKEELKLLFPKDYQPLIDAAAEKYEIPDELLYGLIRSESFFDKDVKSFASAVGLSQLMDSTAGDVAKKLKIKEYDLRDAETNIEFGAFYLAELIRRLNGSQIQALLSYNTGITRIRRWVAQKNSLPMDLFLEIAPYDETREYGRKLTGASSMYAWLYDDKPIKDTVEQILK